MFRRRRSLLLLFCVLLAVECTPSRETSSLPALSGPYLGQDPPGAVPALFAPGIVSGPHHEHSAAVFSPDGNEVYWTLVMAPLQGPLPSVILFMKQEDGVWSAPEVAPFSGRYSDGVGFFSPDGNELYFTSNRPTGGTGPPKEDLDLWVVERAASGWSEPRNLGAPVNTEKHETSGLMTRSGHFYFLGYLEGVRGNYGIYCSRFAGGRFEEPTLLGMTVNTEWNDWCPFVAPDESYIVFSSNRPGGQGGLDLYVSYRREDGAWSEATNLGPTINSDDNDRFPCVSPDGKYLFFLSKRTDQPEYFDKPVAYPELLRMSGEIQNGLSNVFWVEAAILDSLRPK